MRATYQEILIAISLQNFISKSQYDLGKSKIYFPQQISFYESFSFLDYCLDQRYQLKSMYKYSSLLSKEYRTVGLTDPSYRNVAASLQHYNQKQPPTSVYAINKSRIDLDISRSRNQSRQRNEYQHQGNSMHQSVLRENSNVPNTRSYQEYKMQRRDTVKIANRSYYEGRPSDPQDRPKQNRDAILIQQEEDESAKYDHRMNAGNAQNSRPLTVSQTPVNYRPKYQSRVTPQQRNRAETSFYDGYLMAPSNSSYKREGDTVSKLELLQQKIKLSMRPLLRL